MLAEQASAQWNGITSVRTMPHGNDFTGLPSRASGRLLYWPCSSAAPIKLNFAEVIVEERASMPIIQFVLSSVVLALAFLYCPGISAAQSLPTPTCAWQFEWTPTGLGNWLFPDTGNRWWYMPIDPQWQKVTITGNYPKARFFSFAVYDHAPVSTALADHLFDAQIVPDPGSVNPFESPETGRSSPERPQNYTLAVTRTDSKGNNVLQLHADAGWLVYRLLPAKCRRRFNGWYASAQYQHHRQAWPNNTLVGLPNRQSTVGTSGIATAVSSCVAREPTTHSAGARPYLVWPDTDAASAPSAKPR